MATEVLFRNETVYDEQIGIEAGEAFWQTQPAYQKKANRRKWIMFIVALSFFAIAVVMFMKRGFGLVPLAALIMGGIFVISSSKIEKSMRNSGKKLQAIGTTATFVITENFFSRMSVKATEEPEEELALPEEGSTDGVETVEDAEDTEAVSEEEMPEETPEEETEESADSSYARNNILPFDDLIACIITKNLYILIWPKPYFIMSRHGFNMGTDEEFNKFIREKAKRVLEPDL